MKERSLSRWRVQRGKGTACDEQDSEHQQDHLNMKSHATETGLRLSLGVISLMGADWSTGLSPYPTSR